MPYKHKADYDAWLKRNRKKRKRQQRRAALRRKYGITVEEYRRLLRSQGNRCAICGRRPHRKQAFAVDHDHDTAAVRGLLCTRCNLQLGVVETFLERAERYLRKYGKTLLRR